QCNPDGLDKWCGIKSPPYTTTVMTALGNTAVC
ncbi:hypothetical protein A2U01_0107759, partial [Trifolium medium]|nr:hypothetical protein [Trifolium medium]